MTGKQKTTANLPPLSPKDDFVFRKLFGDQNHIDMVVDFLKSFVKLPDKDYAEITIADPKMVPPTKDGKTCILDLKLRTRAGEIIHVEIQRDDTGEMRERMAVYGSYLLSAQLASGKPYKSVKRVISVLITDFHLLDETTDYYTDFCLRNRDGSIVLTDVIEFHILELRKIPQSEDGKEVWRWLKFLSASTEEELTMLQQTYTELQKPVARLMEMSADEIVRHQKDAWDRARRDEEARIRLAEARGKAEVALNLLKEGIPISVIAKATGLSPTEIEGLPAQ
ncbi:MAG: Rpn family recombination-promoting nuclease/putative transposase [Desulfovibrio sp.]|nr:Rpn family recombination-promoting nuclease/putative transposase [Desulfovibrio sp.]